MTVQLLTGDCREVLATLPERSMQCCVTSPPYHGLRAYGGDSGMIGLEPTIDEHIAALVDVFRGVWRVLKDDGTVWLNYGDAYCSHDPGGYRSGEFLNPGGRQSEASRGTRNKAGTYRRGQNGLKPKDLIGLPWRIAFALQADGWYLRSAIIWHKPNPMPESVTDRPTSAYENIFLLTKSGKYFYDAAAIAEPVTESTISRVSQPTWDEQAGSDRANGGAKTNGPMKAVVNKQDALGKQTYTGFNGRWNNRDETPLTRNARNVWTIATAGFSEAHFAVFPPEIPRRCILAGTSDKGECPACGAPWVRVTDEVKPEPVYVTGKNVNNGNRNDKGRTMFVGGSVTTTGWQPSCTCDAGDPVPQTILDPFAGAGTTLLVADRLGRNAVGVEVNPEYVRMAQKRITNDAPLFVDLETA